jgi:hypothetical protein
MKTACLYNNATFADKKCHAIQKDFLLASRGAVNQTAPGGYKITCKFGSRFQPSSAATPPRRRVRITRPTFVAVQASRLPENAGGTPAPQDTNQSTYRGADVCLLATGDSLVGAIFCPTGFSVGTRETRKPMSLLRHQGQELPRKHDRHSYGVRSQPAPRSTRSEPPGGPAGSSVADFE